MMKIIVFIFLLVHFANCTSMPKLLKCVDKLCKENISSGRFIKSPKVLHGNLDNVKVSQKISIKGKNLSDKNTLWLVEQEGSYGFVDLSFIKEIKSDIRNDINVVPNPHYKDETEDSDDDDSETTQNLFSSEDKMSKHNSNGENDETENFSEDKYFELPKNESLVNNPKEIQNDANIKYKETVVPENVAHMQINDSYKDKSVNSKQEQLSNETKKVSNTVEQNVINTNLNVKPKETQQLPKLKNSYVEVPADKIPVPIAKVINQPTVIVKEIPESVDTSKITKVSSVITEKVTEKKQELPNQVIDSINKNQILEKKQDISNTTNQVTESINKEKVIEKKQELPTQVKNPTNNEKISEKKSELPIQVPNQILKKEQDIPKTPNQVQESINKEKLTEMKQELPIQDQNQILEKKDVPNTSNQVQESINKEKLTEMEQGLPTQVENPINTNKKIEKKQDILVRESVKGESIAEKKQELPIQVHDSINKNQMAGKKQYIPVKESTNNDKIAEKKQEFPTQTQDSINKDQIIEKKQDIPKIPNQVQLPINNEKIVENQLKAPRDVKEVQKPVNKELIVEKVQEVQKQIQESINKDQITEKQSDASDTSQIQEIVTSKDSESKDSSKITENSEIQSVKTEDKLNKENNQLGDEKTENAGNVQPNETTAHDKILDIPIETENQETVVTSLSKESEFKNQINESPNADPWLSTTSKSGNEFDKEMLSNLKSPVLKLIIKLDLLSQFFIKTLTTKIGLDSSSKLSQFTNNWLQMSVENFVLLSSVFFVLLTVVYTPRIFKFNRDWKTEFTRQSQLMAELESKLQSIEEVRRKLTVQNHNFEKVIDEYKQQVNEIQEDATKSKNVVMVKLENIKKTNELNMKSLANDLANKSQQCSIFENDLANKEVLIENLEQEKLNLEVQFEKEKSQLENNLARVSDDLNKMDQLNRELKVELQQKTTEIFQLNNTVQELTQDLAESHRTNMKLEKSFENLKVFEGLNYEEFKEKKEILLNLNDSKERLREAEENIERLEIELNVKRGEINNLEEERIKSEEKVKRFEQQRIEAVAMKEGAEVKLKVLSDYFTSKEVEMAKSLGHQVIESSQSLDQVDYLNHRIKILESENEEMTKTIQKLKSEIKETQTFAAKCKSEANEQINNLYLKCNKLERDLMTERDENKKLRTKLSHYCGPTPPRNMNANSSPSANFNHNKDRPPSRHSGTSESSANLPLPPLLPFPFLPQSPFQNSSFSGRNSVNSMSKKSNNT